MTGSLAILKAKSCYLYCRPLKLLAHLCQENILIESLGYGNLLLNMNFVEEMLKQIVTNCQTEMSNICNLTDKTCGTDLESQMVQIYLLAKFCCHSNELILTVNQLLLKEASHFWETDDGPKNSTSIVLDATAEIMLQLAENFKETISSLFPTAESEVKPTVQTSPEQRIMQTMIFIQLSDLEQRVSAAIWEHPVIKSFWEKLISSKSRKYFLTQLYFPSYKSSTRTDLFDVNFCHSCLYTYKSSPR